MVQFKYRKVMENNKMFPISNVDDYVGEANRFFLPNRMDADTFHAYNSPFQTQVANRYSSSTDSTSPESYLNSPFQLTQSTQFGHHTTPWSDPQSNDRKLGYHMVYDSFPNNVFDASLNCDNNQSRHNSAYDSNLSYFEYPQYINSPPKKFPVFESQNQTCSTPVRLRAIVGRKIFDSDNIETKAENNIDYKIWQSNDNTPKTFPMQYELFPSSEPNIGCYTPIKKSTDRSTNCMYSPSSFLTQNTLPTSSMFHAEQVPSTNRLQYTENLSPKHKNPIQYNDMLSPNSLNASFSDTMSVLSSSTQYPHFKTPYKPSSRTGSISSQSGIGPMTICTFCRKNGETPSVYLDHCVKEKVGNKFKVTCPILRALVCQTCGASGDDAHTITYCPVLRRTNNGKPLQSTTITLKSTRIKSDGTKRNK